MSTCDITVLCSDSLVTCPNSYLANRVTCQTDNLCIQNPKCSNRVCTGSSLACESEGCNTTSGTCYCLYGSNSYSYCDGIFIIIH